MTEETFPSILRRSLVIEFKARFLEVDDLVSEYGSVAEAAKKGRFPRDPTLKDFLKSGPSIAAGLRCLYGWLSKHSEADCRAVIEDYAVGGGDEGLTEAMIRVSCGLSQRIYPARAARTAGTAALVEQGAWATQMAPASCTDPKVEAVDSLARGDIEGAQSVGVARVMERERQSLLKDSDALVRILLWERKDFVSEAGVPRLTSKVWPHHTAKQRAQHFSRMLEVGLWRAVGKRAQTANACVPVVSTLRSLRDILPFEPDTTSTYPEVVSVSQMQRYCTDSAIAANRQVILDYLEGELSACKRQGRGAQEKARAEDAEMWRQQHNKALAHQEMVAKWKDLITSRVNSDDDANDLPDLMTLLRTYTHTHFWGGRRPVSPFLLDPIAGRGGFPGSTEHLSH